MRKDVIGLVLLGSIALSTPAYAQKDHARINVENWSIATKTTIVSVKIGKTLTNFTPPIPANFPGEASSANELIGTCLQDVAVTFGNGQLFVAPSAFDSCYDSQMRIIDKVGGGYQLMFN